MKQLPMYPYLERAFAGLLHRRCGSCVWIGKHGANWATAASSCQHPCSEANSDARLISYNATTRWIVRVSTGDAQDGVYENPEIKKILMDNPHESRAFKTRHAFNLLDCEWFVPNTDSMESP